MIQPGLRIGRYEVGRRLGKGGFGVVHLARDIDLDREIAIKVLKPEYQMKPQILQRFLQEARAAAKIGHPGIVTVFECGQIQGTGTIDDGNAYIAMELLAGHSLSDRLLDGGRMTTEQMIAITRQLASALGAAHGAGIVHRDLKPDNIFLVPDEAVHGGERVKILDFGVAKLIEPGAGDINTHSQMMLGTPKYMSPEQARSAAKVDHRSDIYTLGCMMFEMLTARGPFTGDAGDQIVAHQKSPPPSVRSIVPAVPSAIDALILRLLAKDPDQRPQSMTEVIEGLAGGDEPDTIVRMPTVDAQRAAAEITTISQTAPRPFALTRARLAAIVLGAVVLVGVLAFVIVRRGGASPTPTVAGNDAVAVVTTGAVEEVAIDAAVVIHLPPPSTDISRLALQCAETADARKWADLIICGEKLRQFDPDKGARYLKLGHDEQRAEVRARNFDKALDDEALGTAEAELAAISSDSVYKKDAQKRYDEAVARAAPAASNDLSRSSSNECSADDLFARGQDGFTSGGASAHYGLPQFEAAYRCRPDGKILKFMFAAACKSKNTAKAKIHFQRMSQGMKDDMLSFCVSNGITFEELSR